MAGNTERPRRRELEQRGLVKATCMRRLTTTGREASVWRVVDGATVDEVEQPVCPRVLSLPLFACWNGPWLGKAP